MRAYYISTGKLTGLLSMQLVELEQPFQDVSLNGV